METKEQRQEREEFKEEEKKGEKKEGERETRQGRLCGLPLISLNNRGGGARRRVRHRL
jgi:hypothetical protein